MNDIMKATPETLKKALAACAAAHNAEFCDWSKEDLQIAVKSESVPTVSDVRMICESFFGESSMVEVGWGYTNVYCDCAEMLDSVDEARLRLALPSGTVIS